MIAMHELGLVFHVIDDVTEIGKENNLTEVSSVTLQVGDFTSATIYLKGTPPAPEQA